MLVNVKALGTLHSKQCDAFSFCERVNAENIE